MKVYKLISDKDHKGLFKVSLVDDPAIQSNLLYFSEESTTGDCIRMADEEQQIIYAPALIPKKEIFRKNINGEPATVFFDADEIKKLHIDGMRNGYDSKVNLNHQSVNVDGIFCFENWIIEDAVNDKSVKLGFELPVGTLMKGYKIDNDQIWEDVKSGKLKGLSIEGQLFPEEVKEKVTFKKEDMNKKGILAKAFEFFKESFKFAEMTDYGNGYFGSSLEEGSIISDKDGNPAANVEFTFEKKVYKTDDMGAISSIEDAKEEMEVEGGNAELDAANAKITELETKIADLEAQLTQAEATKMANEEAEVKLKADHETALKNVEKLEAEIIELKAIPKIPAEKEIPYEQMTNAQKAKYNRGKM